MKVGGGLIKAVEENCLIARSNYHWQWVWRWTTGGYNVITLLIDISGQRDIRKRG